jgi:predicted transcriptional regulator
MDNQEPKNPFISIHVPVALVALALAVLFFSQIKGVGTATDTMKWQSTNADKQIVQLKDSKEKLAKAVEERKPLVAQSEGLQKTFTEMMKEVNDLAVKGDEDAKKIIAGYGIKIADNAPAAPEAKKDK